MRESRQFTTTIGPVALALLVVLAGCSGVLGGAGNQTSSPTPVAPNSVLPPGVNQTGIVDTAALLDAHAKAMTESGFAYTYEQHRSKTFPNDTTVENIASSGEVKATAGLSTVFKKMDLDRPFDETTTLWTNGTVGYKRIVGANTTFERYSQSPSKSVAVHYMLQNILSAGDWNLTSTNDANTRFVLEANGGPGDTSIKGRLVIDSKGRILKLDATVRRKWYKDDVGRLHAKRTYTYEVTTVGNVSISKPDWVAKARMAVNESTTA